MNSFKAKASGPTLKEQVYFQLLESITKGEFQPNEILNEKALVDRYSVSKSPVREALIELCTEGVLRSIPRYGYEVIRLTDRDIQNIREYRLVIECGYLDKHWDLVTPEKVRRMAEVYARQRGEGDLENIFALWQRNTNFHLGLMSFFDNPFLTDSLATALRMNTRAYAQFYWDRTHEIFISDSDTCHLRLLDALKEGDRAKSIWLLAEDIKEFHTENVMK